MTRLSFTRYGMPRVIRGECRGRRAAADVICHWCRSRCRAWRQPHQERPVLGLRQRRTTASITAVGIGTVDETTGAPSRHAERAHCRQSVGGAVAGLVVLVNATRSGRLTPVARLTALLERRHGDAIREIFQINPTALTAEEAQYLIGFRTTDEIRNRSVAARQETDRRLRAKTSDGLGREAG